MAHDDGSSRLGHRLMARRLTEVVQVVSAELAGRAAPLPSRRTQREVSERVTAVQADGLVGAAQLTAGAFVVDLGMHYIERISDREARSTPGTLEAARKQVLAN